MFINQGGIFMAVAAAVQQQEVKNATAAVSATAIKPTQEVRNTTAETATTTQTTNSAATPAAAPKNKADAMTVEDGVRIRGEFIDLKLKLIELKKITGSFNKQSIMESHSKTLSGHMSNKKSAEIQKVYDQDLDQISRILIQYKNDSTTFAALQGVLSETTQKGLVSLESYKKAFPESVAASTETTTTTAAATANAPAAPIVAVAATSGANATTTTTTAATAVAVSESEAQKQKVAALKKEKTDGEASIMEKTQQQEKLAQEIAALKDRQVALPEEITAAEEKLKELLKKEEEEKEKTQRVKESREKAKKEKKSSSGSGSDDEFDMKKIMKLMKLYKQQNEAKAAKKENSSTSETKTENDTKSKNDKKDKPT
jgi:hypothetical protein